MREFLYAAFWVKCSVQAQGPKRFEVMGRPSVYSLPSLVVMRISHFTRFELEYNRPLGRLPKRRTRNGI